MMHDFPLRTMTSVQGGKALNKPITLLWLLGQYHLSRITDFHFVELEKVVGSIIEDYTGILNIVDPFWRLQNDGILFFPLAENMQIQSTGRPAVRDFREYGHAFFTEQFLNFISESNNLTKYCESLLLEFFPGSYDDDVLERTGLLEERDDHVRRIIQISRRPRNPLFRSKIIDAYNSRCAICGFQLFMGGSLIANEAAHIKWHNSMGPDTVQNGLLLCNLHHKLFDCGVYTLSDDYTLSVSKKVPEDSESVKRWILDYKNRPILLPQDPLLYPGREFLSWHRKYVFKN